MIKIAILNKDSFYSKLLASKLNSLFPGKIKRITSFETTEDVITFLDRICKYDLIVVGDGICEDYAQLVKILKHKKCIANSKKFYRNKLMLDAGAHWMTSKDVVFDSYSTVDVYCMDAWKKPISEWFF